MSGSARAIWVGRARLGMLCAIAAAGTGGSTVLQAAPESGSRQVDPRAGPPSSIRDSGTSTSVSATRERAAAPPARRPLGGPVLDAGRAPQRNATMEKIQASPFPLSAGQISTLERLGWSFSVWDWNLTRRLASRGFTTEQFIQAYSDLKTVAEGRLAHLEAVAVFRLLNVPWHKFKAYRSSDLRLTEFYNQHHLGGPKEILAGWLVMGLLAVPCAATGSGFLYRSYSRKDLEGVFVFRHFGYLLSIGALGAVAGSLSLLISGYRRKGQWLTTVDLENSRREDIERERQRHLRRRETRADLDLRVIPAVGPGNLALTIQLSL